MSKVSWGMAPGVILVVAVLSVVIGLGGFTFYHAKGFSYLSDAPSTCVNCHIMRPQFESWNHSSHRNWATCNDCHLPKAFVNKWFTKAYSGLNHAVKFTTGDFTEPIVISGRNKRIALENCVDCHRAVLDTILINAKPHLPKDLDCTACHGNVGHQGMK